MTLPPRYVTIIGLLISFSAIFLDPTVTPLLTTVLGAHATTKLAAVGALIAALGRALIPPSDAPEPE